ncbi:glycine--tRNA ligase [bacterium]|nr:glycine--tRNA ligase [candidate division CSSED10-310 bacterium]
MSKPTKQQSLLDKITAACKRRGFIFPSSEIYGGINGFWDFGPAGAQLKRNIRDYWWDTLVRNGHKGPDGEKFDIVGLDASIIMSNKVWEASGHTTSFSDPMVDCRKCKQRFRADLLPDTKCPEGGDHDYTEVRDFNLMFKTNVGPVEDGSSIAYLRPETAQAIFVQYQNVLTVTRTKVPFGIAQIGKAFRNEINPRNFIFRSREFEQMEMEFFIKPGTEDVWHHWWLEKRLNWYVQMGIVRDNLSVEWHPQDKLAHYAKSCVDIMFDFPFGVQELEGIAFRTDYDLRQHAEHSKKISLYFDTETNERYHPYVIEPSAGLDRTVLAILCDAYREEILTDSKGNQDVRTVFRFHPRIAPVTVAVFPLLRNRPELVDKAERVFGLLQPHFRVQWDDRGNIGKRYRYQDELGTPYCVTIDFDTIGAGEHPEQKETVTVRDRDTMEQIRCPIDELVGYLKERVLF